MALDGRTRTCIASKGLIGGAAHTGSLFWLVHRTSDSTEAKLTLENTSFYMCCTVHLNKKQTHSWDWESEDLPNIPIRMNRNTIKQHQRLAMFLESKKDCPDRSSGAETKGSGSLEKQG